MSRMMNNFLGILIAVFFVCSCQNSADHAPIKSGVLPAVPSDSMQGKAAPVAQPNSDAETDAGKMPMWINEMVMRYIQKSSNEMIRLAQKERAHETFLLDDIAVSDTSVYFVLRVGHDVSERDGSEARFVTDAWLKIDTMTRKLYEVDMNEDTLVLWTEK